MSQIELAPKTREVLELVIPEWTKKLSEVNFDGDKLKESQQDLMHNTCNCYIGELHEGNSYLEDCKVCSRLSDLAPHVFKTRCNEFSYDQIIESGIEYDGINFGDLADPNVTVNEFLDYIAAHVKDEHRDIMKKCEVLK